MTDKPKSARYKAPSPGRGSKPGERRGGRQKGTPNVVTRQIKEMILAALERAHEEGGEGYLLQQAGMNPVAFMTLLGKVIPLQVEGAGKDGEHLIDVRGALTWQPPT